MDNAVCHPDKKHKARGLCDNCYAQLRRDSRTPEEREIQAAKKRKHYRRCRTSKKWRDKQKDRGRLQRFKRYGLTSEAYFELRKEQNELCACCGDSLLEAKTVHVDHDHVTGKVRGVLCGNCNTGMGMFKDDTARLRKAIDYLEKQEEQKEQEEFRETPIC